jgi:hypothetical protein
VLSESDSKLYTNFEFCEESNHRHFKYMLIYKSQADFDDKINFKKSLYILEDVACGVQVGDIEQANV